MSSHADLNLYLIRHGQTEWAHLGKHTGLTDIPLTELGRDQATLLHPIFDETPFDLILSSPLQRALTTAQIAGAGDRIEICPDLVEWNYGSYEGLTTPQIRETNPHWTVWTHATPNGETAEQITTRADRILNRLRPLTGNIALFSHGHFLRALACRWLEKPIALGQHLLLDTSTLSILTRDRGTPAIKTWNGPLLTAACAVPWKLPGSKPR